jgi:hypothetical protein
LRTAGHRSLGRPGQQPDDAGHGHQVAGAEHLADRGADRDHVGQGGQHIVGPLQVMLGAASSLQIVEGVGVCRPVRLAKGLVTHGHPAVHGDDQDVQSKPQSDH